MAKKSERAVVVTTAHRGVFFGYADDTDGAQIKLRAARNCVYWPRENKGFIGLAAMGPVSGARRKPAIVVDAGGGPYEYFSGPFVKRWWVEDEEKKPAPLPNHYTERSNG